ncbi:hypothetical protein KP78_13560 [Jeotgalibacillus soli]|uniref:Polysaccharide biosynthesis protein C-terminal domain-containing protein n=2 Tax=Jeotgalibacillus soli TaxID=889306 RepID=A0A0C2W172_9BACL|nr:hypothetical protein KP78_13560 [Jeotgalibacillus soli]
MLVAFYFGDSFRADVYNAAFVIPNMFILFLITGMKSAFVPSYINAIEKQRERHHFSQVMKSTFFFSVLVSLAGALLAPVYIPVVYGGFTEEGTQIAIVVSAILFGSIGFVGMNAVLEAYFDSQNKFALSVVSQIVVILSSIAATILFADTIGVYAIAWGYLLGTFLSLLLKLIFFVPKGTFTLRAKFDWSEIKSFYIIFIPVAITVAVGQVNLAIDGIFASYFQEGAVTYITYAKNLVHFPQAIIGVTIGTIIFPMLSRAQATNNTALFKQGIERGIMTMTFFLLPAIGGMMWLMPNIIELLFQRGAFTASATSATTVVAYFYVGSVVFFSLQAILNQGFYALQKGRLILAVGLVSILVNVLLNFVFTQIMGSYNGIPLASSVMAFFYFAASFYIFVKLIGGMNYKPMLVELSKILTAVVIMLGVLFLVKPVTSSSSALIEMIAAGVLGAIIFVLFSKILKISSFSFILNELRNRKK